VLYAECFIVLYAESFNAECACATCLQHAPLQVRTREEMADEAAQLRTYFQ
jgi:hypothetical protein